MNGLKVSFRLLIVSVFLLFILGAFSVSGLSQVTVGEDITKTVEYASDVYTAELKNYSYIGDNTNMHLTFEIKAVHKGNKKIGMEIKKIFTKVSKVERLGIKKGDLYFIMSESGNDTDVTSKGWSVVQSSNFNFIHIMKDKSLKMHTDYMLEIEGVLVDETPPLDYEDLIERISAQGSKGIAVLNNLKVYMICIVLNVMISIVSIAWNGRIFIDNVISFFVNLAILGFYSYSVESVGFYFNPNTINYLGVLDNIVYPFFVLLAVNVVTSFLLRKVFSSYTMKSKSSGKGAEKQG